MKLVTNNRLDPSDPDVIRFNEFLLRLQDGENTVEDWEYVKNIGSKDSISAEDWNAFEVDDIVHLYATNKEVASRNSQYLNRVGNTIVRIDSLNAGNGQRATSNRAGDLEIKTYFCKGAYILLTKNVWQSAGLCNGATGNIVEFLFSNNQPPPGLPECMIVDCGDAYTGPSIFGNALDWKGWVLIFPQKTEWLTSSTSTDSGSASHTRTMVPLRLCYAWTFWKAQGQTICSKVVASLGVREMEHGLTYRFFS